jgi:hypothetical protein
MLLQRIGQQFTTMNIFDKNYIPKNELLILQITSYKFEKQSGPDIHKCLYNIEKKLVFQKERLHKSKMFIVSLFKMLERI